MRYIKLLLILPFIGMLGCLSFVNRIEPFILGMPFFLFWVVLWMFLSSLIVWIVYKVESAHGAGEDE